MGLIKFSKLKIYIGLRGLVFKLMKTILTILDDKVIWVQTLV